MALPHDAMGCLRFVIVIFPDHPHLLSLICIFFFKTVFIWNICMFKTIALLKKNIGNRINNMAYKLSI